MTGKDLMSMELITTFNKPTAPSPMFGCFLLSKRTSGDDRKGIGDLKMLLQSQFGPKPWTN